ncbi:hypothetical protein [Acidithiobacillus sp.]|uniref:hypothetical protein n=1 Tax=Acidithiobacillus sp. TaxID=1872118 RepID=UPI002629D199|nr:hypothetical protein [Acidithiobacillus sp.]MDD5280610.1 hypothetical protein [Acidithiobacillus sp.]
MLTARPILNDEKMLSFFLKERVNATRQSEIDDNVILMSSNYGYLFIDEENSEYAGSFVLTPYSEHAYPDPSFPSDLRPISNLAHIGFITSTNKKNSILDLIKAFSDTLKERKDLLFPLTITAKAVTEQGLLFQYICGFSRAYGLDRSEMAAFGAITINKSHDSWLWAKKNIRQAIRDYRHDIDRYKPSIHY